MEIQEIKINNGNLINIDFDPIPYYLTNPSLALPPTVPVTVQLGTPIIQLPGCVEAHETANPKNTTITQDDKRGTLTFCDGSLPSFNPIQYEPNQMIMTSPDTVEPVKPSKPKELPKAEAPPPAPAPPATPPAEEVIECPTQELLTEKPVGTIFDGGRKEIIGYELQGKVCTAIVKDVPISGQVLNALPPVGAVATTASIALVATTSALVAKPFADILLRVIKPAIKKVMKKLTTIIKKKQPILSVKDRQDQQRLYSHALRKLKGKE
tara:strand:+ start:2800 stop:3600 length:801 start_codon:yes stop_codon:yes gene_type:complete